MCKLKKTVLKQTASKVSKKKKLPEKTIEI
jgi:hypothetical protein